MNKTLVRQQHKYKNIQETSRDQWTVYTAVHSSKKVVNKSTSLWNYTIDFFRRNQ